MCSSEQVELRAGNLAGIVRQSQTLRDAGRRGKGLRGRGEGKSDGDGRKLHLDNAIEPEPMGMGGKESGLRTLPSGPRWNALGPRTVLLVAAPPAADDVLVLTSKRVFEERTQDIRISLKRLDVTSRAGADRAVAKDTRMDLLLKTIYAFSMRQYEKLG